MNNQTSNPALKKWFCVDCRFTLGHVKDDEEVRIKRHDLYVEIKGGAIAVNCPRCGKRNELVDSNFKVGEVVPLKD